MQGADVQGFELKEYIQRNGLKLWQVADRIGMSDSSFSRRLRKPFTKAEFKQFEAIVEKMQLERAERE